MSARVPYDNYDKDDQGLFTNRSTMMANFEEWIKMATDNKINSRNSWNFALIDYFHDLNVLRDSENNINFQKASATLDGCVKIYSSRVDSVTTETGKLLSGLAQKKLSEKQRGNGQNDGEGGEGGKSQGDSSEEEIQIDPSTGLPIATDLNDTHSKRRVHNRVLETTLVEFDAIKMKELDQELNIDPLFKKALVDFDEGGAKSLLLNTLNIDRQVRVVFDTALRDTKENEAFKPSKSEPEIGANDTDENISAVDMDSVTHVANTSLSADITNSSIIIEDEILALGMDYIKFEDIGNSVISPSMRQLPKVVEDITKAKTFIDGVNSKFDNFLSDKELEEVVPDLGPDEIEDSEQFDDGYPEDQQAEIDGGFPYEQEDANTENDAMNNMNSLSKAEDDDDPSIAGVFEQDLMAYFDENLTKSWRGREHWKVRNLKKNMTRGSESSKTISQEKGRNDLSATEEAGKKKKKVSSEIDFFALDDKLEEEVFGSRKRTNIELPQKSRTNDSHYLLPDDFHFTTQKITRLFIKPQQTMSIFQPRRGKRPLRQAEHDKNTNGSTIEDVTGDQVTTPIADVQFWADNYNRIDRERDEQLREEAENVVSEAPENPFEDDEGGVDFNQAFEDEEIKDDVPNLLATEGPAKLSLADNKVHFSRVSKKVDVKKLKDNIWSSIKFLASNNYKNRTPEEVAEEGKLKFTEIAVEIGKKYKVEARKDISTSFCFICLLHLANEHGLKITSTENYEDLMVEFDFTSLQT